MRREIRRDGAHRAHRVRWVSCVWLVCAACGTGAPPADAAAPERSSGAESGAVRALPIPAEAAEREAALQQLGEIAFAALGEGAPLRLLYGDEELAELLTASAATQQRALRQRPREVPAERLRELSATRFAGLCAQGSRLAPPGGALGLRAEAWTLQRVLVIGARDGRRRLAAWVEGDFVYSDRGFRALDIRRVEAPRWEHSDLEIATCDLRVGAASFD